jgi:SAM-dependent methyltransferase
MLTKPRIEGYYGFSNEKEVVRDLLGEHLLPNYERALDVGCGSGLITNVLSQRSKHLHLCEANPYYEDDLRENFPNAQIDIVPMQELELKKYDLILFSQALYYHQESTWYSLIDKLMNSLDENGQLFLILNSDSGDWWRSVNTVWNVAPKFLAFSYIPSSVFVRNLNLKYKVETHPFSYEMNFPDTLSLKDYITKSCIPLTGRNEAINLLIEDHLQELSDSGTKLIYNSELIILKKIIN